MDVALADVALSDVALSDVALSDIALSDIALSDIALSDVALSNIALSDVALSNIALSHVTPAKAGAQPFETPVPAGFRRPPERRGRMNRHFPNFEIDSSRANASTSA